ncbi:MAG: SBBP repeat-containing protein [Acidobacteria bacterium]|nr:SBBP repeat-containing protein [Acidobacteriota bacterium]
MMKAIMSWQHVGCWFCIGLVAAVFFNPLVLRPTQAALNQSTVRQVERAKQAYGQLPMTFERNEGQSDKTVKYLARGHGYQVFLTEDKATLRLAQANGDAAALRFSFGSGTGTPVGLNELPTKSNYILGNDPQAWRANISNFARVEYRALQPGVDLAFYGTQRALEYDFIVAPGADPAELTITIEGADKLELATNGDLLLRVGDAVVTQRAPVSRQRQRQVHSRYLLKGGNQIGFAVEGYDRAQSLVIDPVIDYSTFLGGIGSDEGFAIAVDNAGNAYLTGTTYSNNFNTFAPLQTLNRGGKYDAFVTKLNAAGNAIVYSTYLGGSAEDSGQGIAVDSLGNAYIAGITNSPDFTTRNAFQPALNGQANDAFITKLNSDGTAIIYSSYLGGSNIDQAFAIALDAGNNAYLAGSTASTDFNTRSPLQPANRGGADAFIAKVNASGSALVYSTYLGGSGLDEARGVAVDAAGNAYLTGSTASNDFNVLNAIQANNRGQQDAFVAKLNVNGSALIYSTYLGGAELDAAYDVAVDVNGNAYVTGNTFSTDFRTVDPFQANNRGSSDAFISKFNDNGSVLLFSTYLGGTQGDFGRAIGLGVNNEILVAGRTSSTDFNNVNAVQDSNRGNLDAFVSKFNAQGSALLYSTYLGGAQDDFAFGLAVDNAGNAYITGDTRSTDFNTRNPVQAANRGGLDAFVSKLNASGTDLAYSTYLGGSGEAGNAYVTGYTSSNDYITRNPLQATSRGGLEVFVTKILADSNDIAFNTYFGGNGSDTGNAIAVDGGGNAYITGATTSTNLPTRNPWQPAFGGGGLDAFVAKFNASGSNLIYSTYLGGSFGDQARGIAVDAAGNAYITGSTFSDNFPTQGPLQATHRGLGDAFITKLNAAGSALLYSTYLGGAATDEANAIAIDATGAAYIAGDTFSSDFNTRNALQASTRGQQDAFIAKLTPDGAQLAYSTYLGGRRNDLANGIAVDAGGNAYITGSTTSPDFNTANPLQNAYGGGDFDAFVAKLNAQGSALAYSTYLGGALSDNGNAIAVDASGNAYITGVTSSTNFPRANSLQADNRGGNDAFITKLNAAGTALLYSTYLGGLNDDRGAGITVDSVGTAYITGATASPNFNIQVPLFAYGGGTDVFVAKILSEPTISFAPPSLELQPGGMGTLTINLSAPQNSPTFLTLSSSNVTVATATATVTIAANSLAVAVPVTAVATGTTILTAALPQQLGGATATASITVATAPAPGFEGDVAPRPNGNNGQLTVADWVQTGRFAAGFDTPALGSEFQRADCAPRDTRGNGAMTISDWVQAGRYAAGLDPVVAAGGPTAPNAQLLRYGTGSVSDLSIGLRDAEGKPSRLSSEAQIAHAPRSVPLQQARAIRVASANLIRGQNGTVTIELDAQGNENGLGFSLNFDPAQLMYVSATNGPDAVGASININSAQAATGRIGFALALPAGQALTAGTRRLFTITFTASNSAASNSAQIGFADQPVTREVVNPNAETLTATFTPGTVNLARALANVSAASFIATELAAESIVASFGTNLATGIEAATTLPLPTTLRGTTVRVRDSAGVERLAPLFFVAPDQINYLLPAGLASGAATVTVTSGDNNLSLATINIAAVAPGLFTANANGQGVPAGFAIRQRADGSQSLVNIAVSNNAGQQVPLPLDLGPDSDQLFLVLFGTGMRGRTATSAVTATIGGVSAEVLFAGAQGDLAGLDQINLRIPRALAGRGEIDVQLRVDGKLANAVRIAIK